MGTNVVADRGTVAVQEKERTKSRRGRIVWISAGVLTLLLIVAYLGISGYMFDKLTHPERKALEGTPTQYEMQYQDVTFNSTVDNVPLSGWFIDSPGDKAIIMIHGRGGNRAADESLEKVSPLLAGKQQLDGRPTAYVCENFTCSRPVTNWAELKPLLEK